MLTGDVVAGRFELLEEVGKTRAFREYRARDRQLNRIVSVKVLRVRRRPEPAVLARLHQHAREATQLVHPRIARVYMVGTDGGRFYVVEDFPGMETLRERLDRSGPLALDEALGLAVQVCEALSYAHGQGICHGALTPESVLLSPAGESKLRDFAASGALVRAGLVDWDAIPERVPYVAPEQITQNSAAEAADIYALGALLFEMLAGEPPFGRGAAADAPRRMRTLSPPNLADRRTDVPPRVAAIITKALAKQPQERWKSASRFGEVLEAARADRTAVLASATDASPTRTTPLNAIGRRDIASLSHAGSDPYAPEAAAAVRPVRWGQLGAAAWAALRGMFWTIITVAAMLGLVLGMMWHLVAALPEDRVVPDVVNKPVEEAKRIVEGRGLKFRVARREFHSKVPVDHVIKMSPYPGKTVKVGREVSVVVSRGEPLVSVPLLSGTQYGEAVKRLKELSLKAKKTGERASIQVSKGGIVSQWPLAGQQVPKGSEVRLVVSSGSPVRRRTSDDNSIKKYKVTVELPPGDKQRLVHIETDEDGVPVDKYTRWHDSGETVVYILTARAGTKVRVFVDEQQVFNQRLK